MRRFVALAGVVVVAILLQSTVFSGIKLLGAKPELLYIVTVLLAIIEGPREGMIFGFSAGMSQDFFLNQPKGVTALTLTLLAYTVGLVRTYIVSPSPILPTLLVAVGTFGAVCFYQVVRFLLGDLELHTVEFFRIALLTAIYNGLLTPIVYPSLRRVFEGSRPRRVVRF
ncbi:MAG: rod shape-determining protein MreD [Actinobacteria bacterium]|nr:rod shape-determining protein MreD [Actinomycetota bacterium]